MKHANEYTKMKKTLLAIVSFFCSLGLVQAQEEEQQGFRWEGFVDVYYAYDFNEPANHIRQPFLYNHNRHNEFNLNLGLISGSYTGDKIRANLAIQAGTYAQDNYSAEEDLLKHVFQANVGVALNDKDNLWLDAGIFPSHIGFESAISTENLTLTRSLLAENSPYFLSGAKLTYDPTESLTLAALVTNGWQRIARVDDNQTPGVGTQLNYHPTDAFSINWSTFIGSDTPDDNRLMRYFNNIYAQWQPSALLEMVAGFDIGTQESLENGSSYHTWYTPIVIARVQLDEKLYLAGRAEYYADEEGVIIDYGAPAGFRTLGLSLNLDYEVTENAMFRIEARHFNSPDDIFASGGNYTDANTFVVTSLAVNF
ncbi:porin [Catalinimonas sp. 4WD22]|uniref:porin n=1 Tax=Catalinimonas locisalis TaxID=3133978 RepID=UPI00310191B0